jgi:GDP-L-fucose synthase
MNKDSLIFVAGHEEFMGSAIVRKLNDNGYGNVLLDKFNLFSQAEIERFFNGKHPEYVFLPWVKAGGITANISHPAELIYQNLTIQTNIIHSAYKFGVKKLLYLASPCSYPKFCNQPIKEEYLLTGPIEPTNEPYAIAKISGIKMCQAYRKQYGVNFICAIPTNVYGPNDDFGDSGHVIPGLIKKFIHDNPVKIWGTGSPKREFIYIDDLADACIFLMGEYNEEAIINIAGGQEVSIKELAEIVKEVTGYLGELIYETDKPDGMPRRLLDSSKISTLGWKPKTELQEGLKLTVNWYKKYAK